VKPTHGHSFRPHDLIRLLSTNRKQVNQRRERFLVDKNGTFAIRIFGAEAAARPADDFATPPAK
jgi:hypothetical protein